MQVQKKIKEAIQSCLPKTMTQNQKSPLQQYFLMDLIVLKYVLVYVFIDQEERLSQGPWLKGRLQISWVWFYFL